MNQKQKKKQNLRRHDRHWKADKFPSAWAKQFQLHHDWENGARVYFLTPEEHRTLTDLGL